MRSRIMNYTVIVIGAALIQGFVIAAEQESAALEPMDRASFAVMAEFFEYDRSAPIEPHLAGQREVQGALREKLVLGGVGDRRAPGYLAIPAAGEGPHPCVILIHGIGGSKEDWWTDESFHSGGLLTSSLLEQGVAVLTLDVQYHGERSAGNDYESPERFVFERGWLFRARDMIIDSVVEHRRAIDYLETRTEIDPGRISVLGYSMGGMMALQLAAVDDRITACASSVSPILKGSPVSLGVHHYAPSIEGIPVLMMIGEEDSRNYAPEEAQAVLDSVDSDDRTFVRFESGHRLPVEWTSKASEWLVSRLR